MTDKLNRYMSLLDLTYDEGVEQLLKQYGKSQDDYFKKNHMKNF